MEGYKKTKPWTQWLKPSDDLSIREVKVDNAYFDLGYKAAILEDSYCIHTGIGRCTWQLN